LRCSERLLLMPRTYQINDYPGFYRSDVPSNFFVDRSEHQLPRDRLILANFNQLYKIDPDTLSRWAQILRVCSGCVLWLLAFPYQAKDNILKVTLLHHPFCLLQFFKTFAGVAAAQRVIVSGKNHAVSPTLDRCLKPVPLRL
jgi:hypothetical protein